MCIPLLTCWLVLYLSLFSMPCSFPMGMKQNSGILLEKRETNSWDALESESATEREAFIYDKNTGTICSYEKELMGLLLSKYRRRGTWDLK